MLRSHICDYSDASIVIKGIITFEGANSRDMHNRRSIILKNKGPFNSCVSKN